MSTDNNSFVLYTNYFDILNELSTEDAGYIFKAILEYKATGSFNIPAHLTIAFKFIKNQLDIDCAKYEEKCNKAKTNGLKGGRPKNLKNQTVFEKPNGFFEKHNDNDNDNVNDNDNDNVNVNVNENVEKEKKEIFNTELKTFFISEYEKVFKTRPFLSRPDCERLLELQRDNTDIKELIPQALNKLKGINFKEIGFKPGANWLLRGNNFERILNGEFRQPDVKNSCNISDLIREIKEEQNANSE